MEKSKQAGAALIASLGQDAELYAMGASISKIVQMSSDSDGGVDQLANAVLSDLALSQKILKMSNMAIYRGSAGSSISTVSKAIFVLGFEAIKMSALAILLVEGLSDKSHAASVSREIAIALGASLVARRVSGASVSPGPGDEDAGLAALFKNLGSLLLASKNHELYKEVRERVAQGETAQRASMEVLGCSLDQIAASAMRVWKLPEGLVSAATGPAPKMTGPARDRSEWVRQVACASLEASATMCAKSEGRVEALEHWCSKHAASLGVERESLGELMGKACEEARSLMGGVGDGAIETIAAAEPEPESCDAAGVLDEFMMSQAVAQTPAHRPRHPSGKPFDSKDILLAGIGEATQMLASGQAHGVEIVMGILETLHVGMGFRLTLFCARDPATGMFRARAALGEDAQGAKASFSWGQAPASGARDIFRLAMEKGVDVTIADASAPNIKSLVPAWHKALLPQVASFVALPLIVDGKPVGMFYADRASPAPEGVSAEEAAMLRALKAQAIAALKKKSKS